MRLPLLLVGAIVLVVFAIIASSNVANTCLGVSYYSWVAAALLSFFVDILFGSPGFANGKFTRTSASGHEVVQL